MRHAKDRLNTNTNAPSLTRLSVTSVTSKEEGVYECRASNKAGTASRSTKLVVVDGRFNKNCY